MRIGRRFEISPSSEGAMIVMGLTATAVALVAVALGMDMLRFDAIVGLLTLVALLTISVPLTRSVVRAEGDAALIQVLIWAIIAKVVFTLIRYFFIVKIYGDQGDAGLYSSGGAIFMELFRQGDFTLSIPALARRGPETERIAALVGFIYMITGVSRYAASFVFSALCFSGQILMYRAFRRGVPEGDGRRYLVLVLFLPSLLFWPSSIGKEALMLFFIGVVCFGAAQLLGSHITVTGVVTFFAGTAGLFFIRPHMALIGVVSLTFASAVSAVVGFSAEPDKKGSSRSFAIRMLTLVVLIAAAAVATTQLSKVLGDGSEGGDSLSGVLDRTKSMTAEGGSQFEPPAVTSPLDVPNAVITVLFRPFPWEASNAGGIIASAEGVLLAAFIVSGRRRLLGWAKTVGRRPYLVFAATFAFTFIVAFSYIGNFGILARQRTQMLPLALTLLALPAAPRQRDSWFGTKGELSTATSAESEDAERRSPLLSTRLQSPLGSDGRNSRGENRQ